MKILRVKKSGLYDVFIGSGWKNHTRVLVKDGHVYHKEGVRLTRIQIIEVSKSIGAN